MSPAPGNSRDLSPQVRPKSTGPEAASLYFLHSEKGKGEVSFCSLNLLCTLSSQWEETTVFA